MVEVEHPVQPVRRHSGVVVTRIGHASAFHDAMKPKRINVMIAALESGIMMRTR